MINLVGITRKEDLRFVRKTKVPQSNQSFWYSLHSIRSRGSEELDGQVVSIKQLTEQSRGAGRLLLKREKVQDQERILTELL